MRALVVYESMYGNTRAVAQAVADGLSTWMAVERVEVADAPRDVRSVGLLVVGAPTHAFGLSRVATRASAAEQGSGEVISGETGIREWLELVEFRPGIAAAAFDTRVDKHWIPGSAASVARRRMARAGLRPITKAESFYVGGMQGPLLVGEVERARAWGSELGERLATVPA